MTERRWVALAATLALAALAASCSDDGSSTATTAASTSTSVAASTTTESPTSTEAATTTPSTAAPTTSAAPASTGAPATTTVPTPTCATGAPIAAGATNVATISGDIDGDTLADTVTSYTLGGVPHVHATTAAGGDSDVEVPVGNADTVSISFMDFDHSLGAEVPAPLAVLAIGAAKAGTAVGTFLTLNPQYCIRVWHNNTTDDTLFTFRISAEPIYEGLQCDGAAGSINHSLTSAEPNSAGGFDVTLQPFGHDFTTVQLHPVENLTVPADPDIQHEYGDLTSCGLTLFP
jgi:hypothetical protein